MQSAVQRLREWLVLLLIGLLPFHAFLVTAGTKLALGPNNAPWAVLALWKEAVLGVILLLALVEFIFSSKRAISFQRSAFSVDVLDVLILSLAVLAVAVSIFAGTERGLFLLGVRYDFVPLVAFLVLRRVPWSEAFHGRLMNVLLGVGALVSFLGIISLFLPVSAFVRLGYADAHSLYTPGGPLSPFQQIAESWVRRVQSTMSGPNQLGIWLLIPLGALLSFWMVRGGVREYGSTGVRGMGMNNAMSRIPVFPYSRIRRFIIVLSAFFMLCALFLTFSRAAWIAVFVMVIVMLWKALPRRWFVRAAVGGGALVIVAGITAAALFPSVFFRLSSSRGHLVRPLEGIGKMIERPLGWGLGAAGPASNRVSETCVFLRPQDDPSWAKAQPQLCVFLGSTQVQPTDHACRCPFLPENWYIQIGVELGVLGFALFLALVVMILRRLRKNNGQLIIDNYPSSIIHYQFAAFLAFLGVSIAALFLHAWEDAAVAYTGWILISVAFSRGGRGA
ncbi:MAG: O-antigen ligase family protein [Candidatus Peribacteraceae bacterium]|nr:O-antigen ligase family protein [Candidatus Peribacteraceae bacterium]